MVLLLESAAFAAPDLDQALAALGGVAVERSADRAVVIRWSGGGVEPLELDEVHLVGGGVGGGAAGQVQVVPVDRVPEGAKATERCGVAHVEVALPIGAGTATFCLVAGGAARFDGPIEVTTPTWRAVGTYRDGARVGPWRLTDPAGVPLAEGEYQRDLPTGTWTVRGAAVPAGEGTSSVPLRLRPLDVAAEGEPTVEVMSADLVEGHVAVRIRWSGATCDGLVYEVLRPSVPDPEESWVVSGPTCPTASERAERLGKVRSGLAAHGLDGLLPPAALIPKVTRPGPGDGPQVDLEGHHIAIQDPPPADLGSLEPAELIARLPWLDAVTVEASFEGVPVERRRAPVGPDVPAVVAERGRWAVLYTATTQAPGGWRVAVGVGPVHTVAEGL